MTIIRRLLASALIATAVSVLFANQALANPAIRIGYVKGWPASSLVTKIARRVIENKLNRSVVLQSVNAGTLYRGVASGALDAQLSAWLPTTHHAYYSHLWDQMINLGPNLLGATLGVAVPEYAAIDSIQDLRSHAGDFDYKIIGVDLGAGVNINTKKAIAAYDLSMHLVPSSTASMSSALKQAIANHELIAVTGWKPLWIWHQFDLKMLDDPKNIYGSGDHINTIVNPSLWGDAPRVFKFLDRVMIPMSAINDMEAALRNGKSETKVIATYLEEHRNKIKTWTYGLTE